MSVGQCGGWTDTNDRFKSGSARSKTSHGGFEQITNFGFGLIGSQRTANNTNAALSVLNRRTNLFQFPLVFQFSQSFDQTTGCDQRCRCDSVGQFSKNRNGRMIGFEAKPFRFRLPNNLRRRVDDRAARIPDLDVQSGAFIGQLRFVPRVAQQNTIRVRSKTARKSLP